MANTSTVADRYRLGTIQYQENWSVDREKTSSTETVYMPSWHNIEEPEFRALKTHPAVKGAIEEAVRKGTNVVECTIPGSFVDCVENNGSTEEYSVTKFEIHNLDEPRVYLYWPPEPKNKRKNPDSREKMADLKKELRRVKGELKAVKEEFQQFKETCSCSPQPSNASTSSPSASSSDATM